MPKFINCGATHNRTGERIKTKKQLKELLRLAPEVVTFDRTAAFDYDKPDLIGGDIPDGVTLTVVGPDPYNRRIWYASVWVQDGRIRVV